MENNRKINIILSLIIAFCGWLYVMYNVDPTTTRTFRNVSITYSNEKDLEAKGIALKSADKKSVEIEVEGHRSELNKMDDSDIKVRADLSDAGKGENTLSLHVQTPPKVNIVSKSDDTVTVNTEAMDTRSVPGRVEYRTESTSGTEPIVEEQSSDYFSVTGAKSKVKDVEYVRIPVEEQKLTGKTHTYSVSVIPVDRSGNEITHVKVNPAKASVAVFKGSTKSVPLNIEVNNPANDEYLRTYSAPKKIEIKGKKEVLEKVESISAEPADLEKMTESGRLALKYKLPDGVFVANRSLNLGIIVNVTEYRTKEIEISTKDVTVKNLNSKYKPTFEDKTITVEVTDTGSMLESLTAKDFDVSVDARGLRSGSHSLKGTVNSTKKLHKVELESENINIYLSKKD